MALEAEHKLLLQIFLNNRLIGNNKLKDLYLKIFGERRNEDNLSGDIEVMNQAVACVQHKIEKVKCEMTGQPIYIYHSIRRKKSFDSVDRIFTRDQKVLISLIIQEILESDQGVISYNAIRNMASQNAAKASKAVDSEELVNKLLEEHLLLRTDEDMLFLSALAIKELEPYFKENYEEFIQDCQLCASLIVHGINCRSCQARIHKHCLKHFAKSSRSQASKCPRCNEDILLQ